MHNRWDSLFPFPVCAGKGRNVPTLIMSTLEFLKSSTMAAVKVMEREKEQKSG